MRAVQIVGPRQVRLVEAAEPTLRDGEVLVQMRYLSICGSDMRAYRRSATEEEYPFPVGLSCHECAGVVVESRAPEFRPGQQVIALPPELRGGAELVAVPPHRLIPLPQGADLSRAVLCQPWGTVRYACQQMGSILGRRAVVLGQGAIGLLFTMTLERAGAAEVVAVDLLDDRMEWAKKAGATLVLNPLRDDVGKAVRELTEGRGADIVVEAAGTVATINQAVDLARVHGQLILFGIPQAPPVALDYDRAIRKQLTLTGTVNATLEDPAQAVREAVGLYRQGRADLSWLVTHRLPFSEAPRAYDLYDRRADNVLKVIMEV
ncbi:MAG: zinc-binding dehydrogenase [Chloroflexi bacterium]|nr:zinc-binding dehydrogenase [Chloroflexota bacterium]